MFPLGMVTHGGQMQTNDLPVCPIHQNHLVCISMVVTGPGIVCMYSPDHTTQQLGFRVLFLGLEIRVLLQALGFGV